MKREGPALEALMRRLAETPAEFLAEPRLRAQGVVEVAAVVFDLGVRLGGRAAEADLTRFAGGDPQRDRNRLAVTLLLAWLLSEPWFVAQPPPWPEVLALIGEGARELDVLRTWRDEVLLPTGMGRVVVACYDRCSPWMVRWLEHRPRIRAGVRRALDVLVRRIA